MPICEVVRAIGSRDVAIALDIQLTRLVSNLNLKWSINDSQIKTIVEDIIDKYPNESIEDFVLCFKSARQGNYGELVRLDSAIIFRWIQEYLDAKYEALEDKLAREKDNPHEVITPSDEGPGYKAFKEYAKSLTMGTKVPDMPQEYYDTYGKEKPVKKQSTGHAFDPVASAEQLRMQDLRMQYGREHCDKYTGKVLPGSPSFDEFVKQSGL